MKLGNVKDVAVIAAMAGGAYLVYKLVGKAGDAAAKAGSAVATATADFQDFISELVFGPKYTWTFLTVNFANGVKHSIPMQSQEFPEGVNKAGLFKYNGSQFRIRDKVLPSGVVEHWAFKP